HPIIADGAALPRGRVLQRFQPVQHEDSPDLKVLKCDELDDRVRLAGVADVDRDAEVPSRSLDEVQTVCPVQALSLGIERPVEEGCMLVRRDPALEPVPDQGRLTEAAVCDDLHDLDVRIEQCTVELAWQVIPPEEQGRIHRARYAPDVD